MNNMISAHNRMYVDWCLYIIRMYSQIVFLWTFRMGYYTTVTHFAVLLLLSIWNFIARHNMPMLTKWSCLNVKRAGFNTPKVNTKTVITPSNIKFLLFQNYTLAGLHQIWFFNTRYSCQLEKQNYPLQRGAKRLNNEYNILKLQNVQ